MIATTHYNAAIGEVRTKIHAVCQGEQWEKAIDAIRRTLHKLGIASGVKWTIEDAASLIRITHYRP